jgi:type I restriction enzyme M protein
MITNKELDQKSLEKYLWGAATALRGTIDAGDYKQYIFPLLFFKRISDVYDEEFEKALAESDGDMAYAAFTENHHFQIPEGAHWKDVRETTVNIGQALQNAMRAIEQANPDTLHGIFGDASWTNKERLTDTMLTNLLEHYSQQQLNLSNVPDDKLGNAYEYLIKEFADDSGHTAAEFYTNRTVVKLMTMIMDPQPGESVYDPTCGSGGLLLNCAVHLKDEGKEYRTLKLYGQEINLLTSAIARMNMFMHGIEEFDIVRGDTLANPGLLENDELKKFNVILANPPYSIKSWDQKTFDSDPFGRNLWGTPPQGCADYAFQQHIQKSLDKGNGRSISLWPHGILFRDSEAEMRRKMIEDDLVDCVIGLGPNLFYNSPMEACLLITATNKPAYKKGKVLFINAVNEVRQDKTIGFLDDKHIERIFTAYQNFDDEKNFAALISNERLLSKNFNMAINLYVRPESTNADSVIDYPGAYKAWEESSAKLKSSMNDLFCALESLR